MKTSLLVLLLLAALSSSANAQLNCDTQIKFLVNLSIFHGSEKIVIQDKLYSRDTSIGEVEELRGILKSYGEESSKAKYHVKSVCGDVFYASYIKGQPDSCNAAVEYLASSAFAQGQAIYDYRSILQEETPSSNEIQMAQDSIKLVEESILKAINRIKSECAKSSS